MRKQLFILSFVVAGATACAGRPSQTTLNMAAPVAYSCDNDRQVLRDSQKVSAGPNAVDLGWQDDAGDHFVAWPASVTTTEAVEYVMPNDQRANAVERIYDTTPGRSRADWRVKKTNICTAHNGYTAALNIFSEKQSLADVASQLGVDRREAGKIIHTALMKALTDYHRQTR